MESKIEDQPLKIRSTGATVAAGFRLFSGNFRRIFRATWLPALLYALGSALYTESAMTAITQVMHTLGPAALPYAQGLTQQYLMQSGMMLLDLVVTVVLMSYVFHMLTCHRTEGAIPYPARWWSLPESHSLTRTMASAGVWVVIHIVLGTIISAVAYFGVVRQSLTLIGGSLVLVLIATCLLLPLFYPHLRFLTTADTHLGSLLRDGYRQGLRHWGYIFSVLFVVLLLAAVILSVTMLPAIVLIMAGMKSETGTLTGDPSGMPSYMGWLSVLVFTLAGFIQAYVVIAVHFPAYYMAGSIEQQEIQRNEKAKTTLY